MRASIRNGESRDEPRWEDRDPDAQLEVDYGRTVQEARAHDAERGGRDHGWYWDSQGGQSQVDGQGQSNPITTPGRSLSMPGRISALTVRCFHRLFRETRSSPRPALPIENGSRQSKRLVREVMICASQGDRVDLEDMMKKLAGKGIIYVLVEGGGELNSALLEAGLVDKIAFFYAPVIIGGKEAVSSFMGQGIESVADAVRIHRTSITRIDGDFLVEGYVERQG